jgi:endogenous inhibitor of DNA gyrase (YacG/DUF329 family)
MRTEIAEVECPFCRRRVSVQVFRGVAEQAAAGDPSEVYERCPRCARTFAVLIPVAPPAPTG